MMRFRLFLCCILSSLTLHAQKVSSYNEKLKIAFNKINACTYEKYGTGASDSLIAFNDRFERLLLQITSTIPSTLSQKFTDMKDLGLMISTSEDGLFRIYTWDDQSGGTMRGYRNVFQYVADGKVYSKRLHEDGDFDDIDRNDFAYEAVHNVTSNGKKFYITYGIFIASSALYYHKIKVFSIDGLNLNGKAKLIKTKTGIKNELSYEIDFTIPSNRNSTLGLNDMYTTYQKQTNTISLPLIAESGKLTMKRIKYQFNGRYFEKIPN